MSRQGDLFAGDALAGHALDGGSAPPPPPPLLRRQLLAWQERVAAHQGPPFAETHASAGTASSQGSLFGPAQPNDCRAIPADPQAAALALDPLALAPQSLSFWRWPSAPHQGAALYLVLDRPADPAPPLLLYVGETGRADRRWKGDHDCKSYLAAYGEALATAGLNARLSIRFWLDVPAAIGPRRALEQALIRRWLPPFNKETRGRWTTPFTADAD
jgi:hypothetical protein